MKTTKTIVANAPDAARTRTVVEDGHTYRVLTLTHEQRSMIASAVVGACNLGKQPLISEVGRRAYNRWHRERHRRSLCCSRDKLEACAQIVGDEFADALQEYVYEGLGCGDEDKQQHYLDAISDLVELRYEVVN